VSSYRILPAGDRAFVVEFGDAVDRGLSQRALALDVAIEKACIPGVEETVPTFRSLLVSFDPRVATMDELVSAIADLADQADCGENARRSWRLPVCYDPEFGVDLDNVARYAKLLTSEVVALHSG
jgi:allophanate hydrolase subunit 1